MPLFDHATEASLSDCPPEDFGRTSGFEARGKVFVTAAWRLTRKLGRPPAEAEVDEYVRAEKKRCKAICPRRAFIQPVRSHFLDSGAFTLTEKDWKDKRKASDYLRDYLAFIRCHADITDRFCVLDKIGDPETTHAMLAAMERAGFRPVPVVHYKSKKSYKWLRRYIDEGYKLIAFGGSVGSFTNSDCKVWLDDAFEIVCKGGVPRVKVHGFGAYDTETVWSYPWYSVDTTSWFRDGGTYGRIYVPRRVGGRWDFRKPPHRVNMSLASPSRRDAHEHFLSMTPHSRQLVHRWLAENGLPLGATNENGEMTQPGVLTKSWYRQAANIVFFQQWRKRLPGWKRPFRRVRAGLGMLSRSAGKACDAEVSSGPPARFYLAGLAWHEPTAALLDPRIPLDVLSSYAYLHQDESAADKITDFIRRGKANGNKEQSR
jgi:hypothetical protein